MKKENTSTPVFEETNFNQEKLSNLLRYAAYAERCAFEMEIPMTFSKWKEITN